MKIDGIVAIVCALCSMLSDEELGRDPGHVPVQSLDLSGGADDEDSWDD